MDISYHASVATFTEEGEDNFKLSLSHLSEAQRTLLIIYSDRMGLTLRSSKAGDFSVEGAPAKIAAWVKRLQSAAEAGAEVCYDQIIERGWENEKMSEAFTRDEVISAEEWRDRSYAPEYKIEEVPNSSFCDFKIIFSGLTAGNQEVIEAFAREYAIAPGGKVTDGRPQSVNNEITLHFKSEQAQDLAAMLGALSKVQQNTQRLPVLEIARMLASEHGLQMQGPGGRKF